jgi:hypothetical protein
VTGARTGRSRDTRDVRRPLSLSLAWSLLAALVVVGCQCGAPQTSNVYAGVELLYPGEGGVELPSREGAVYDFGAVAVGETVVLPVRVRNTGNAELTLTGASVESGDATSFTQVLANEAVFNLDLVAPLKVPVGGTVELRASFRPPVLEGAEGLDGGPARRAVLQLATEGTRPDAAGATLELRGKPVSVSCDVARRLDFGAVQLGDVARLSFTLRNPTAVPTRATVGLPQSASGDHLAFFFADGTPQGTFTLPPESEREIVVTFTPGLVKRYLALMKVRVAAGCPEIVLSLEGSGVEEVLSWTPALVDCRFAPVGFEVTREVTFSNLANTPVQVSGVEGVPADFRFVPSDAFDGGVLEIPAGGEAKVLLGCRPTALGLREGEVRFQTSLPGQPTGRVTAKVLGGGPDIDVSPAAALPFGQVAWFPGAVTPTFQARRVVVRNVGTRPAPNDDSANLKLGRADAAGVYQPPRFEVVPVGGATQPGEFTVTMPGYDPAAGLPAVVGQNAQDVLVKFTPASLGLKEADLVLPSNDPDEPEVRVRLSAEAVSLPPCNLQVTPSALSFGVVTPPQFRDLTLTLRNLGSGPSDTCLVSNLDLVPGTNPTYSLPAGPVSSRTLQAGESLQVLVRSQPTLPATTSAAQVQGKLRFYVSSPLQPEVEVPLQTTVVTPCLTVAPDEADFGTVKLGCSSGARAFGLYNTCPAAVEIKAIRAAAPAGLPAGAPGCPGPLPCPEFQVSGAPALPLQLQAGAVAPTFLVTYAPVDVGPDVGTVAVEAVQGGQSVVYLVPLSGVGDSSGENLDTFQQDPNPSADILITVDDSCSMAPYQGALAANFAAFIQYANQVNVDYRIAVTTTDDRPGGEQGRFVTGVNHPEKILTPTTPNVAQKFAAKVAVGTSGNGNESGLAPSLKALTAPLTLTDNAGFLRPDANLGVLVVTDAPDQSAGSAAYYLSAFLGIKGARKANQFSLSAVAGFNPNPPSTCPPYDTAPDDGKYRDLVSATRGVQEEICTQDWAQSLQRLGKNLFGYRSSFFLTARPDPAQPLQVSLDGVDVPAVDALGNPAWTYDALTNSITLQPLYVPEPGQTLQVHYVVSCYP